MSFNPSSGVAIFLVVILAICGSGTISGTTISLFLGGGRITDIEIMWGGVGNQG